MEAVLLADTVGDAELHRRRHPGRWTRVVTQADHLRGLAIGSVDVTYSAARQPYLINEALNRMAMTLAYTTDATSEPTVGYLDRL